MPEGVAVSIGIGEDGEVGVTSGGGSDSCDWTSTPMQFSGLDTPDEYGEPPSPEHRLYLVFCNAEYYGFAWYLDEDSPVIDTVGMASTVVDQVPVDLAAIGARPQGRAVTGMPSYFWVEGYAGAPITGSVTNGPVTVDVAITLGTVTWDFGDGTPPLTAGLGEAWPARSSIRHTYRDRGTYAVTVTIVLPAQFTVNGGVPTPLPPVVRTASITYVVDEVQAVRDR